MKRVCSLCLSLVLAFVLTCPALAAVTATEPEIAAAYLKERGIMVGAEDMSIIATTKSGETVTIFENGEWAF